MSGSNTKFIADSAVLLVTLYSLLKFCFFALPYRRRRAMLDKAYAGRAQATQHSDLALLAITLALAALVLATSRASIPFLGGMFVGATLIQLFFHSFHQPVARDRKAPDPTSPLKELSYAIQDRPERALKVMIAYASVAVAATALLVVR